VNARAGFAAVIVRALGLSPEAGAALRTATGRGAPRTSRIAKPDKPVFGPEDPGAGYCSGTRYLIFQGKT